MQSAPHRHTPLLGQVFSHLVCLSSLFVGSVLILCLVDPIDIVKDYIPPHEYLAEEDPKLYQSVKTKRGPLSDDWIEEISQNHGQSPVMCAYKLCKVEFRYWGMQSKIERFIHDVGKFVCVCKFFFSIFFSVLSGSLTDIAKKPDTFPINQD